MKKMTWKRRMVSAALALSMVASFLPAGLLPSAFAGTTHKDPIAEFTLESDGSYTVTFTFSDIDKGSLNNYFFAVLPDASNVSGYAPSQQIGDSFHDGLGSVSSAEGAINGLFPLGKEYYYSIDHTKGGAKSVTDYKVAFTGITLPKSFEDTLLACSDYYRADGKQIKTNGGEIPLIAVLWCQGLGARAAYGLTSWTKGGLSLSPNITVKYKLGEADDLSAYEVTGTGYMPKVGSCALNDPDAEADIYYRLINGTGKNIILDTCVITETSGTVGPWTDLVQFLAFDDEGNLTEDELTDNLLPAGKSAALRLACPAGVLYGDPPIGVAEVQVSYTTEDDLDTKEYSTTATLTLTSATYTWEGNDIVFGVRPLYDPTQPDANWVTSGARWTELTFSTDGDAVEFTPPTSVVHTGGALDGAALEWSLASDFSTTFTTTTLPGGNVKTPVYVRVIPPAGIDSTITPGDAGPFILIEAPGSKTVTITMTAAAAKTVTAAKGAGAATATVNGAASAQVEGGKTATLAATPATGYDSTTLKWTLDPASAGSVAADKATITVNENLTATASYGLIKPTRTGTNPTTHGGVDGIITLGNNGDYPAGFKVELLDGSGATIATGTTTGSSGAAVSFTGTTSAPIRAGVAYKIRVTDTTTNVSNTSDPITLGEPGAATVTVYLDGVAQSGVQVSANNGGTGGTTYTATTNASGQALFNQLSSTGTEYTVTVTNRSTWTQVDPTPAAQKIHAGGDELRLDFYTITTDQANSTGASAVYLDSTASKTSGIYQSGAKFRAAATAAPGYTGNATWSYKAPASPAASHGTPCGPTSPTASSANSADVTVTGTSVLTAAFGGNSVTVTVKLNGGADKTGKTVELYDGSTKVGTATANTSTGVATFTAIPGGKSYDIYVGGKTGVTIPVTATGGSATLNYYEVKLAASISHGTVSATYGGSSTGTAGATIATILSNTGATNGGHGKTVTLVATPAPTYQTNWAASPADAGSFNPNPIGNNNNGSWTLKDDYNSTGPIVLDPAFGDNGSYLGSVKVLHNGVAAAGYKVTLTSTGTAPTVTGTTDATGVTDFGNQELTGTYTVQVTASATPNSNGFAGKTVAANTVFVDTKTLNSSTQVEMSFHDAVIAAGSGAASASVTREGKTVADSGNPPTLTVLAGQKATLGSTAIYSGGYGGTVTWTPTQAAGGTQSTVSGSQVTVNKPVTVTASYEANEIKISIHKNGPADTANTKKVDLRLSAPTGTPPTNPGVVGTSPDPDGVNGVVTFANVGGGTSDAAVTYHIYVDGAYTGHTVNCAPGRKVTYDLYYYDVHFVAPVTAGGDYTTANPASQEVLVKGYMTTGTVNRSFVDLPDVTVTDTQNFRHSGWTMLPAGSGAFRKGTTADATGTADNWRIADGYTTNLSTGDPKGIQLRPEFERTGYSATVKINLDGKATNGLTVTLNNSGGSGTTQTIGGVDGRVKFSGLKANTTYSVTVGSGSVTYNGKGSFKIVTDDLTGDQEFSYFTVSAAPDPDGSAATAKVRTGTTGAGSDSLVFLDGTTAHFVATPATGYVGAATWHFTLTNPTPTPAPADKTGNTTSYEVHNTIVASAKYTKYEVTVTTNIDGSPSFTSITSVSLVADDGTKVSGTKESTTGVWKFTDIAVARTFTKAEVKTNVDTYPAVALASTVSVTNRSSSLALYSVKVQSSPSTAGKVAVNSLAAATSITAIAPEAAVLNLTASVIGTNIFTNWTTSIAGAPVATPAALATTYTVPGAASTVTANFIQRPTPVVTAQKIDYQSGEITGISIASGGSVADFWWMVQPAADSAPSATTIKGKGNTVLHGSTPTGTGDSTWPLVAGATQVRSGLSPHTQYKVYVVAEINGEDSNVGASNVFTTDYKVTVKSDANGTVTEGTNTINTAGKIYSLAENETLNLDPEPTDDTKYIFKDWTSAQTGTAAVVMDSVTGDPAVLTAKGTNATPVITANFEPIYGVEYNYNATSAGTVPPTVAAGTAKLRAGSTYNPAGTATRTGYTFKGWAPTNSATNGVTSVNVGTVATSQSLDPGDNIILYAVWSADALSADPVSVTAKFHMANADCTWSSGKTVDLQSLIHNGTGSYTLGKGNNFPSYLDIDSNQYLVIKSGDRITGNVVGSPYSFTVTVTDDVSGMPTSIPVTLTIEPAQPYIADTTGDGQPDFTYNAGSPDYFKDAVVGADRIVAVVRDPYTHAELTHINSSPAPTTPKGAWTASPAAFAQTDGATLGTYTFTYKVTDADANNYLTVSANAQLTSQKRNPTLTVGNANDNYVDIKNKAHNKDYKNEYTITYDPGRGTLVVPVDVTHWGNSPVTAFTFREDTNTGNHFTKTVDIPASDLPLNWNDPNEVKTQFTFTVPGNLPVGTYTLKYTITATADPGDDPTVVDPVLTYTYTLKVNPAPIDHAILTGLTPPPLDTSSGTAPVANLGKNPSPTSGVADNSGHYNDVAGAKVAVSWSPNNATFEAGQKYTATVTLTPNDNYIFVAPDTAKGGYQIDGHIATTAGLSVTNNPTGANGVLSYALAADGKKVTLTYVFDQLPAGALQPRMAAVDYHTGRLVDISAASTDQMDFYYVILDNRDKPATAPTSTDVKNGTVVDAGKQIITGGPVASGTPSSGRVTWTPSPDVTFPGQPGQTYIVYAVAQPHGDPNGELSAVATASVTLPKKLTLTVSHAVETSFTGQITGTGLGSAVTSTSNDRILSMTADGTYTFTPGLATSEDDNHSTPWALKDVTVNGTAVTTLANTQDYIFSTAPNESTIVATFRKRITGPLSIKGTPGEGNTLSVDNNGYSVGGVKVANPALPPTGVRYQWSYCNDGTNWNPIAAADGGTAYSFTIPSGVPQYAGAKFKLVITYKTDADNTREGVPSTISAETDDMRVKLDTPDPHIQTVETGKTYDTNNPPKDNTGAPVNDKEGGVHIWFPPIGQDDPTPANRKVEEYTVILKKNGTQVATVTIPADGRTDSYNYYWPADVTGITPGATFTVEVQAKPVPNNGWDSSEWGKDETETGVPGGYKTLTIADLNIAVEDKVFNGRTQTGVTTSYKNSITVAQAGNIVVRYSPSDSSASRDVNETDVNITDGAGGHYTVRISTVGGSLYKALPEQRLDDPDTTDDDDTKKWDITKATAVMNLSSPPSGVQVDGVADLTVVNPKVTYPTTGTASTAKYYGGKDNINDQYDITYYLTSVPTGCSWESQVAAAGAGGLALTDAQVKTFTGTMPEGDYQFNVVATYKKDANDNTKNADPQFAANVSEVSKPFTFHIGARNIAKIDLYRYEAVNGAAGVNGLDTDVSGGNQNLTENRSVVYGQEYPATADRSGFYSAADAAQAKQMSLVGLRVLVTYDNSTTSEYVIGQTPLPSDFTWVSSNTSVTPDKATRTLDFTNAGATTTNLAITDGNGHTSNTVVYRMNSRPLDYTVHVAEPKQRVWNGSAVVTTASNTESNKLAGDDAVINVSRYEAKQTAAGGALADHTVGKDKTVRAVSPSVGGAKTARFYHVGTETPDTIDIYPAHINPMEVEIDKPSTITVNDANRKDKVGVRVKQKNDESNQGGGSITFAPGTTIKWEKWNTGNNTYGWEEDTSPIFQIDTLYRATVVLKADTNHYFHEGENDKFYNVNGLYDGDFAYLDPEWKKDASKVIVNVDEDGPMHGELGVLYWNEVTISFVFDTSETPELRYSDGLGAGNDANYHHSPNKYVTHTEDMTIGDDITKQDLVYTINLDAYTRPIFGVTVSVTDNDLTSQTGVTLVPTRPAANPSTSRTEMKLASYRADGTVPGDRDYNMDLDRISYTLTIPQALLNVKGTHTLTLQARGASSQANVEANRYDVADNRYTFVLVVREKQEEPEPQPPIVVPGGGGGGGGTTVIETPVVKYLVSDYGYTNDLTAEKLSKKGAKPSFVPKITPLPGLKFLGWAETDPAKSTDGKLPALVDPLTFSINEDKVFYAVYERVEVSHSHYVIGFPDGTFGPDHPITRGQVATIIARACLEDFIEGGNYGNPGNYTDVDSHWANSAIAYCSMKGVFTGYTDGTFRPDRYISRQELATVVARLAGVQVNEGLPFSDNGDISSWALNGVYTNYVNGWVNGYTDGTFKPLNNITRAETVKIFNGYLNRGVDKEGLSELREYVHQGVASNNTGNGTDEYMTWPDVAKTHWAYYEIIEAANDHNFRWRDATKATPPEEWYEAFIDEVWRYDDNAEDGADDVGRDDTLPTLTVTYVVKSGGVIWESITEEVTKFASPSVEKLPKAQASEGYRFAGWSETDPDEGEISLIDPTAHPVLEDKTFYAVFEPDVYEMPKVTITYVVGDHGSTDMPLTEVIDMWASPTVENLPKITAQEGWEFKGWSETDPAAGEVTMTDPTDHGAPGDSTFYAVYEPVEPEEPNQSPEPQEPPVGPDDPIGPEESPEPQEPPVGPDDPIGPEESPEPAEPAVGPDDPVGPEESPEPQEPAVGPDDPIGPEESPEPAEPAVGPDDPIGPEEPAEPVEYVRTRYINGYTDDTFRPDDAFTRAAVATVIANLMGYDPSVTYADAGFDDLADHWGANAIHFCVEEGLLSGYTDNTFRPDNAITRQEFAIVLTRLTEVTDVEPEELPFADVDTIAPWALESVSLAYAKGWIGGYEDGTFLPERNVTRAEAVKMFNAYLGRSADPERIDSQSGYTLWTDVPATHWAYYEIIEASNDWVE